MHDAELEHRVAEQADGHERRQDLLAVAAHQVGSDDAQRALDDGREGDALEVGIERVLERGEGPGAEELDVDDAVVRLVEEVAQDADGVRAEDLEADDGEAEEAEVGARVEGAAGLGLGLGRREGQRAQRRAREGGQAGAVGEEEGVVYGEHVVLLFRGRVSGRREREVRDREDVRGPDGGVRDRHGGEDRRGRGSFGVFAELCGSACQSKSGGVKCRSVKTT